MKITRRELIGGTVGLAAGSLLTNAVPSHDEISSQTMIGVPFERKETVKMGIIGCGLRAKSMIRDFLGVDGLEIVALCDNVAANADECADVLTAAGRKRPSMYTDGDRAYEDLCRRGDLDIVYIATPWEWHAEQSVFAMEQGIHVGVEVPMATTIEDLWRIVEVSEKTRRHCIMLENCCFNFTELLVLNMVRDGVFGELTHAEAAYIHDLRYIVNEDRSEGLWRRDWHTKVNGNLYPTHGLGPVANYLEINRGDSFDYMVSMSSPSKALDVYREATVPRESAKWKEKYITGDMNTSLIKTSKGISIMLQHDVVTPRPYDRINLIQGTKGIFRDFPQRLHLDGQEGGHRFTNLDSVRSKYEHNLWKRLGEQARGAGHGGMDFVMAWRLVQYFKEGLVPDIDVYDGAAWSAPFPLSAESVQKGSAPVKFPDFTNGHWSKRRDTLV